MFYIWLTKLCAHRIFKKNEALSVHQGVRHALSMGQGTMPSSMASVISVAPRNAVSTSGPAGGIQQLLFIFPSTVLPKCHPNLQLWSPLACSSTPAQCRRIRPTSRPPGTSEPLGVTGPPQSPPTAGSTTRCRPGSSRRTKRMLPPRVKTHLASLRFCNSCSLSFFLLNAFIISLYICCLFCSQNWRVASWSSWRWVV